MRLECSEADGLFSDDLNFNINNCDIPQTGSNRSATMSTKERVSRCILWLSIPSSQHPTIPSSQHPIIRTSHHPIPPSVYLNPFSTGKPEKGLCFHLFWSSIEHRSHSRIGHLQTRGICRYPSFVSQGCNIYEASDPCFCVEAQD